MAEAGQWTAYEKLAYGRRYTFVGQDGGAGGRGSHMYTFCLSEEKTGLWWQSGGSLKNEEEKKPHNLR